MPLNRPTPNILAALRAPLVSREGSALIFVLVIIGGFFLLIPYVRNHFFPAEESDKRERAFLEMQMLQARLESSDEEGQETPGEEGGPPAPEGSDPPERTE